MEKLSVKDLINAGLFSVLMIMVTWAGGMSGLVIFLIPVMTFIIGILTGPVFMLYSTKIDKFGMIMIMSVVFAIVFGASGHGIYVFLGILLIGFLCEKIMQSGGYKSINKARLAYTVFMLYAFLNFVPIIIAREEYFKQVVESGMSQEYVDAMSAMMPLWALPVITAAGCLGAYIGCTIGIKMLKKHFERANMV